MVERSLLLIGYDGARREDRSVYEQVEAVQRMQDYIEAHQNEPVTLADLARASCFSPWYACRLFRELTGISPADYVRRLKLSRSALRLRDEGCRVTDVAFDLGFGSVDGYQRAFLREFGCNPHEYAKNPVPLPLFVPYGVKYKAIRREAKTMENIRNIFIQVIEKPARKALIKRGVKAADYFAYCEEVGCDVWGLLLSMPDTQGEPVCLWLPERYVKPGTSTYVQGVEVSADYAGAVPAGFDVIELPAARYLLFQGEPFAEEDYCEAISAVQTAMDAYDPAVIGLVRDMDNPRIQLEPRGARGYIEMYAVKPAI